MAIEYQYAIENKHRCTDCGAKWYPYGDPTWEPCPSGEDHPCPKCSAKPEPVACGWLVWHEEHPKNAYFCPGCGVALPKREG